MVSLESTGARGDQALGSRIRAYRTMRRLTLKQVATHVGVSEGFLSQVERGASGASVATLRLIAQALGLSVSDLFSEGDAPAHRVLEAARRPVIHAPGVVKYMLTQRPLRELEVLEGEFEPGASTGGAEYVHGDSLELVYVIDGTVRLTLGPDTHSLSASDSIEYRSSIPHGLTNIGDRPARILWIISPPSL